MSAAFLFGAGAEAEFNLCTGEDFAKRVIGIEKSEEQKIINKSIKDYYSSILKKCRESKEHPKWYPEKCYPKNFNIDILLKNSIKRKRLMENKFPESIELFTKEIKKDVKSITSLPDKEKAIYSSPNYMGILDENFHTIISPRALGPQKFWAVIFAITRAYVTICNGILDQDIHEDIINQLISNPNETYSKIIEMIRDNEKFKIDSYYKTIKSLLTNKNEKIDIISTNYTPIAEIILNDTINKQTYIHGHIKLFESPYYLQVTDISENYNADKFSQEINFPYLFLQSGVKPIVERKQLNAYSTMLSILDNNETLFVLGYNFNGDDNHINSLLHDYLHIKKENQNQRKNQLIFFDYCNDKSYDEKKKLIEIQDKLRIPENNRHSDNKVKIEVIHINKDNCILRLKDTLDRYITTPCLLDI